MTTRPPQHIRYLTPKRREFLRHFVTHPVIPIDGIYQLLGTTNETQERAARRFARDLAAAGYLLRRKVWNTRDEEAEAAPHWHYVYRLSKYGAATVNGKDRSEQTSSSVEHDAEVTNFMLALEMSFPDDVYIIRGDLKRTVHPDKAFGLRSASRNKWFYFFLEVERQRQSLSRTDHKGLIDRILKYDRYRKSEHCMKDWKLFSDFRVIVVLPSEELQVTFLKRLSSVLTGSWVWVTTTAAYKAHCDGAIFKTPADYTERGHSIRDI